MVTPADLLHPARHLRISIRITYICCTDSGDFGMANAVELSINTIASALAMAQSMFGSGITIVDAKYTGDTFSSGIYSGALQTIPGISPTDSGVILSTGYASAFTSGALLLPSSNTNTTSNTSADTWGVDGYAPLKALDGANIYDAAIFEANFIPSTNFLTMQFVFSSEEYLEYVNAGFNDAFGVWVNGQFVPFAISGDGHVAVDTVNTSQNSNLYVNNPASLDLYNTEMDGFTVTLTLKAPVQAGQTNSIKIAIGDAGDAYYDSNLLIMADSIQSVTFANNDSATVEAGESVTLNLLANDNTAGGGVITVTKINGVPVVAGQTVVLPSGEHVTLNADGTVSVLADLDTGTQNFSYTIKDSVGNTDVGYVTVTTTAAVPCFVAGTPITTDKGERLIETLRPGDMVATRDHGLQPLRWIGKAEHRATGKAAPVRLAAGALGDHGEVWMSQNHRVMLSSVWAELLFGEHEVLVHAKDLVNDHAIRIIDDGRKITYVHLLFDQHEIITTSGLDSESYHPGRQTISGFDADTRDEILALMPNSDAMTGFGYGPTARTSLRHPEALALLSRMSSQFCGPSAAEMARAA